MKTITTMAAQGDCMFRRVEALPEGATAAAPAERVVVAHSETGHHHVAVGSGITFYRSADPLVCYLSLTDPTEIQHERPFDTHETLQLLPGVWELRRQKEWTVEGFRRVED